MAVLLDVLGERAHRPELVHRDVALVAERVGLGHLLLGNVSAHSQHVVHQLAAGLLVGEVEHGLVVADYVLLVCVRVVRLHLVLLVVPLI